MLDQSTSGCEVSSRGKLACWAIVILGVGILLGSFVAGLDHLFFPMQAVRDVTIESIYEANLVK